MNSRSVLYAAVILGVVHLSLPQASSFPLGVTEFAREFEGVLDRLAERFVGKVKGAAECDGCKAVVALAHVAFALAKPRDEIVKLITRGCEKFKIEDTRVCVGIVQMFKSEVLTVVDDVFVDPNEVCGKILGPSCAHYRDPSAFWNVTLPKTPKPTNKPILPPKVSSRFCIMYYVTFSDRGVT